MNLIKNANIAKKISFIIVVSIVGLMIVGLIGINNSNSGYNGLESVNQKINKKNELKQVKENLQSIQNNFSSLLAGFAAYEGILIANDKNIKFINTFIKQKKNMFEGNEKKLFSDFAKDWEKAQPALVKVKPAIGDEDDDAIRAVVENDWVIPYSSAVKKINKLYADINKESEKEISLQENSLSKNLKIIYVALAVVVFAVLFISIFIVKATTKPLTHISTTLQSNDGNDLKMRLNMDSSDEIGIIAKSFDTFFEHLSSVFDTVKTSVYNNTEVSKKSSQITTDMNKKIKDEQTLVEQSSQKGEEVQSYLENSLEATENSNRDIAEANSKLTATKNDILSLVSDINNASQVENELASKLSNLSDDTQQVKDVLNVISDIADQTNLLALNAAIEAARAGEHGRGFAVVADEVRNLAERTQKSLVEIDSTISVIVQSIVESSEDMSKNSKLINELSNKSNDIEHKVDEVVDIMATTSEISLKSLEDFKTMSDVTTELINEIKKVNDISNENTSNIDQVVHFMNELDKSSQQLNDDLTKFKT